MTTEEKAKAYDEALEIARQIHGGNPSSGTAIVVCEQIFPQLRESEDERIRAVILKLVLGMRDEIFTTADKLVTKPKVLAWLKKQKEQKPVDYDAELKKCKDNPLYFFDKYVSIKIKQKPAEWSEEDEKMRNLIVAIFEVNHPDGFFKANELGTTDMRGVHTEEIISWLKSLRPVKQEWDTHDKAIVNCIVCCLDGQFVPEAARKQALKWFNKHRRDFLNSPSWKPSEEQMEALEYVIRDYREDSCNATANYLQEILDHLKNM